MDWTDILSIIGAIIVAVGFPLAWRSLRKSGQKKAEELYRHLTAMGLDARMEESGRVKHRGGEKSVGVITIRGRNIDFVDVFGISSQFQPNYFIDYSVETPEWKSKEATRPIQMKKKRGFPLGKIEWKGQNPLTQVLNADYSLEDRLLSEDFKGAIQILPSPKQGACIRTSYFLPSPGLFEGLDTIAGYLKKTSL